MSRATTFFIAAVAFSVLLVQHGLALGASEGASRRQLSETGDAAPEWTYRRTSTHEDEPYGPSDWYLGYPDCGSDAQSPININAAIETAVHASEFDMEYYENECDSKDLVFYADGHVWKVSFTGCEHTTYLMFDGDKYNLLQLHIHSPSEHMIGGAEHDAEIHFVHLRDGTDDELLVVGVMLDVSDYASNYQVQKLWQILETGEETTDEEFTVSAYDILPANLVYSHYMGSLTTPPCTEGVKWIVMTEPTIMSRTQLDDFRTSVALFEDSKVGELSNTNRPVQPLNDRAVYLVTAA